MEELTVKQKKHDLYKFVGIPAKVYIGLEKEITITKILKTICTVLNVDQGSLFTKNRKHELVQARQIIFYMVRKYTNNSYGKIATLLVRDDNSIYNHATIIHGINNVDNLREVEPPYNKLCTIIEAILEDKVTLNQWKLLKDQEIVVNEIMASIDEKMPLINTILKEIGDDFIPKAEELKEFLQEKICSISLGIVEVRKRRWKDNDEDNE